MAMGKGNTQVEDKKVQGNELKSGGTTVEVKQPVVTSVRIGGFGGANDFWYRDLGVGELAQVTNEHKNYALGIRNINVLPPSENQAGRGILARVQLELGTADVELMTIRGLTIRESKNTAGAIYVQEGSRNIAQEGQADNWYREVTLKRPMQAQILAYIDTLLVPNA